MVGLEFSEWRDADVIWRTVLKWNLERRDLNLAIELKWHALWNRAIMDLFLADDDGVYDDDALRNIRKFWCRENN